MRTGILITCRLASTRLPRKHLLKVNGKTMIEHLIDRVKCVKKADKIFICTTTNPEDIELVNLAMQNNIGYFCGCESDILKRHLDCAIKNEIDLIVNVDGDDIFCDSAYIDMVINTFEKNLDVEIVKTEGLPFGMNSMGYKRHVLENILRIRGEVFSDTGWGEYLNRPELFKIEKVVVSEEVRRPYIRATLDYEDDFIFFKTIIEKLHDEKVNFDTENILKLIDKNPWISEVNSYLCEEYWNNYNAKKTV